MAKLFGPQVSQDEQDRRAAQKALVQRESDMKNPATGDGISVTEAALRLGIDAETVNQMIADGTFQSARRDVDRTGENEQSWVSGVEVFRMRGKQFRATDSDLH